MKIIVVHRKKTFLFLISLLTVLIFFLLFQQYSNHLHMSNMVMGGKFYTQVFERDTDTAGNQNIDVEKYFRPSDLPVLNDRSSTRLFDDYFGKKVSEIVLPAYLLSTPEDTILNYFSLLREAANPLEGSKTGCGSLGSTRAPYPVAYNFLSTSYQKKLPYDQYLRTFENILHINLIKYKEVPVYDNPSNILRYFVEIETIEGSKEAIGNFVYYYGFVDLINEEGQFKISNLKFHGENYLCAPYHGWSYDAEASVEIRYGGWCSLVKEMYPVEQKGFVKNVYFKATDGNDYMIQFYQLTNDNDIEIAQYRKSKDGNWELIKLDPKKCLKITPSQAPAK